MLIGLWRFTLFGTLQIEHSSRILTRFRTHKTASLLAYLAYYAHQEHTREVLVERFWPESGPETGRLSLRVALSSLRRMLEPPGTPAGTVLLSDHIHISLNPNAIITDVIQFENLLLKAKQASDAPQALKLLEEASALYQGPLLCGFYEDWVLREQQRQADTYLAVLKSVVEALIAQGDLGRAIEYARRAVQIDPLDESAHGVLMRLYDQSGQPRAALRHYEEFEARLREDLSVAPSPALRVFAEALTQRCGDLPVAVSRSAFLYDSFANQGPTNSASSSTLSAAEQIPVYPADSHKTGTDPTASPRHLPIVFTRFFGRGEELARVGDMLGISSLPESLKSNARLAEQVGARLVTITGPGGTGKTRLALEAAAQWWNATGSAVYFVELAEITDPDGVTSAIAGALHLAVQAVEDPLDLLATHFAGRPVLLVLDNYEQLAETGAWVVQKLLERIANLHCLVTSRHRLHLEAEREFPLLPLVTPFLPGSLERLVEFPSVQLFLDRAQAARPDFQITSRNAGAIASLCHRLEGIPLALEMAAAWSSVLSPGQILERMRKRLDLLVGRNKGQVARHRTLRAAIEWSYSLLSPSLQLFFVRLSVFRGGWTVEAAAHICDSAEALEQLLALRDRSLITVEEVADGETDSLRFRLLETLREFAAEQLSEAHRIALCRRHLDWYVEWGEMIRPHLVEQEQALWLQRAGAEQENVRAALHESLEEPEGASQGLQIIASLSRYWCLRGNYAEVRSLLDRLRAQPNAQESTEWRARSLDTGGMIAGFQNDWAAAKHYYEEYLLVAQCIARPIQIASALMCLGNVAENLNDMETARHYFEESCRLYEVAASGQGIAAGLGALGSLAMKQGDFQGALSYHIEALTLLREGSNLSGVTHHIKQLAITYANIGETEQAYSCFSESLEGYLKLQDLRGLAELLYDFAKVLPISEISVHLMSAAQSLNASTSAAPFFTADHDHIRAVMGDTVFAAAWAQGSVMTAAQAVEKARYLLTKQHTYSLAPEPSQLPK